MSKFLFLLSLVSSVIAQELAPTEQTSFSYPQNGAGISLPFPSDIASLTGLSEWPGVWVTPPFTPNMNKLFDPSATAVFGDIITPPNSIGATDSPYISDLIDFCQTFDDGPTDVTSNLLDFLASVNQKNTFFEIGSQIIENYPLTQRE